MILGFLFFSESRVFQVNNDESLKKICAGKFAWIVCFILWEARNEATLAFFEIRHFHYEDILFCDAKFFNSHLVVRIFI